jgi:Arc/MetJ-type ribon-helix-helix transcriptional regulator
MTLTLDPETERLLQRELDRGVYKNPDELISHALGVLAAEEDWLLRNKEAINADLDESFAESARGEGYSIEEAKALLAERRTSRAA